MENRDFYEGLKTDRELNKEHVDAAEHFVRLKTQTRSPGEESMLAFARGEGPELFEKEAGIPKGLETALQQEMVLGRGLPAIKRSVRARDFMRNRLDARNFGRMAGEHSDFARGPTEDVGRMFRSHSREDLAKIAGLPEASKGDTSPRTYKTPEGSPIVGWDSRRGYNFTTVPHQGKHHSLVDHHSSGRVGHIIMNPETGVIESSEIHPSHKHMTGKFHDIAKVMNQHLHHAHASEGAVKTAMRKLGFDALQGGEENPGGRRARDIGGLAGLATPPVATGAGFYALGKHQRKKEKDSCMTKGAEHAGYFVGPYANPKIEKLIEKLRGKKEKDSCMGKMAGIRETLLQPKNLGAAVGALLLGGSTYLTSLPKTKYKGKSPAEVELEGAVRHQQEVGEEGAGFTKKVRNRLTEFNHGLAKVYREHPIKGAISSAVPGAVIGRFAASLLGEK